MRSKLARKDESAEPALRSMPSGASFQNLQRLLNNRSRQEVLLLMFMFLILIGYCSVSLLTIRPMPPPGPPQNTVTKKLCRNQTMERKAQSWPKIIHQTWKDENIPDKFRSMQESCRVRNPEYEYKLWTDADLEALIKEHYPWFLQTYRSYPYTIEKIDSARLFIVHHYGGVYLDIDIECKVRFSTIQKEMQKQLGGYLVDVVLAQTDPLGITNNILMSQPGTPFLEFVTHRLLETNGYYFSPHWTVMFSAGPIFLYRSYLQYPCKDEIQLISTHDHASVYFNHIQARTWHNWDGPFITWFDYHGRTLLKVLAVVLLVVLIVSVVCRCRRPIAETLTMTHRRWSSGDSDTWKVTYDLNIR